MVGASGPALWLAAGDELGVALGATATVTPALACAAGGVSRGELEHDSNAEQINASAAAARFDKR
jgi:hypothetical protein